MLIGTKNDTKLKSDLNANEMLVKDFKDKCQIMPSLLDCRNRAEIKATFGDILERHVRRLHPEINIVRKDTISAKVEEKETHDEPKLLPKKDDGCTLI